MKKNILALSLMMCAVLLFFKGGIAEEKEGAGSKKQGSIFKTTGTPAATLLNINKISAWYESNGECERNPADGNSGFTYPRGTATAIYASGLVWGGKVTDGKTPIIRAGGSDYNRGVQPGAILGTRTGKYEDASDSTVRIWRIRRDYATADLRQDAAESKVMPLGSVTDGDIADIRKQYQKDWQEWPAAKGAPFYDRNGDGVYTPRFLPDAVNAVKVPDPTADEPGVADADQVIWFVCHDLAGASQWASPQIGLEQQTTIWGYNRSDALGNVVFKKFKLIYKGTSTSPANAKIDDMYMCQWSDPDLGDAGDDFAGCDTVLSLGYVYNSKTLDKTYRPYNIAPPASGYDFLQGPIVKAPGKTAVFDLKYKPGYMNLPMTSFIYFAAGGKYSDPPHTANGAIQWYQMLRGLPPTPQGPPDPNPEVDPKTTAPTFFWLPGDPVTGKGWIDGLWDTPGDRRIMLTSGPFNMAIGDTQELVSATIAGLGSDRLSSVSVLKFYDQSVQAAYDNLFDLPKPPVAPKFSIVELDKALIIEWEKDSAGVIATESSISKGYKFEGYNVYQLPSATSPLSNGVKIATFDLETDPSTITQPDFDEASGQILLKPVQLGKNSGLSRYWLTKTDAIKNRPFINGQRYYFAVTAYSYIDDPAKPTRSYESSPAVQEAMPHSPNAGIVMPYILQDTLATLQSTQVAGSVENDARLGLVVFNPTAQHGNTYEVWYGGSGTALRNFTLVKTISGSTDHATVISALADTNAIPKATGTGWFTINDAKTQVRYKVTVSGLTGPITSAQIHMGAAGTNGLSVHAFNVVNNAIRDSVWLIPDSLVDDFISGNLYVAVNTAAYPGGEIRGQIADGLFPRAELPGAVQGTTPITSYTEHRVPGDGISFFAGPAPIGVKKVEQTAPSSGNVLNAPDPGGIYSIIGPVDSLVGDKASEADYEIRFVPGINYAAAVRADTAPTGLNARFIQVPFAVYQIALNQDTTRIWPVIKITNSSDTVWNTDAKNPKSNGKLTFDRIVGIADTLTATVPPFNIKYYSPSFPSFPPSSSTLWKGRLISSANHTLKNITFVSEKGGATPPAPATGTVIKIKTNKSIRVGDVRTFTLKAVDSYNPAAAKTEVSKVNVFPNPYYGLNSAETSREVRFVTISHLPQKATVRVFNLAGTLIRTLVKDDASQFMQWDLLNQQRLPVASGMYILHVDMGDLGVKVLKCAIIQEQQFLRNY